MREKDPGGGGKICEKIRRLKSKKLHVSSPSPKKRNRTKIAAIQIAGCNRYFFLQVPNKSRQKIVEKIAVLTFLGAQNANRSVSAFSNAFLGRQAK